MKVKSNSGDYDVRWRYGLGENQHIETVCTVSEIDPNKIGKERFHCLAVGQASLNPQDHFEKSVGRKLSLARALKLTCFCKAARKIVWETYLSTCKR